MLKIEIYSEFPNETPESELHLNRINEFKEAVRQISKQKSGRLVFDYVSKYKQFEMRQASETTIDLNQREVQAVENLMPNCWI